MRIFDKIFKSKIDNSNDLKVGDWVNSYSKGIYRIEKIIENFYDESDPNFDETKLGEKSEYRTIISKRFLNAKFKKSISYESCSEFFIKRIDEEQRNELNKFMEENRNSIEDLNTYEIPELVSVYNSELQINNEDDLQKMNYLVEFIKKGKTFLEIQNQMIKLDILKLKPKHFGNYRFQIMNFNDEYQNKRKIWRDAKLNEI